MKKYNKDINIFVVTTKKMYCPSNKYYIPFAVNNYENLDYNNDAKGENISKLNPRLCELTCIYWAWKNIKSKYYGFYHYRRFLSFGTIEGSNYYNLTEELARKHELDNSSLIEQTLKDVDIVLPKKMKFGKTSLLKQFGYAHDSLQSDLLDACKVVEKLHPECKKYIDEMLESTSGYFCNIFIMKDVYFNEYCKWIFPILFEIEKNIDFSEYSLYRERMVGFIAERLFNVFISLIREKHPTIKIKEVPLISVFENNYYYLSPLNDNKVGICFASDSNCVNHLGVALSSLVFNVSSNKFYDIIILDNGMTTHDKNMLNSICYNRKNVFIRYINVVEDLINRKLFEDKHINKTAYARFLILKYLRDYKKIVYLDCDIVINSDISALYEVDLNNYWLAAARDTVMADILNERKIGVGLKQRKYNKEVLKFNDKELFNYFSSGVLVFNIDSFLKNNVDHNLLFNLAKQRDWEWLDQGVFNYLCKGKVFYLDNCWNFLTTSDEDVNYEFMPKWLLLEYKKSMREIPKILHFAGHQQPMYNHNTKFEAIYWEYARRSPFYERLFVEYKNNIDSIKKSRRFINKIKRKFKANTKAGILLRKIYHKFK